MAASHWLPGLRAEEAVRVQGNQQSCAPHLWLSLPAPSGLRSLPASAEGAGGTVAWGLLSSLKKESREAGNFLEEKPIEKLKSWQ